jgi:hypothetical protein
MSQINFPTSYQSIIELFDDWNKRHADLAANSPLKAKITDDGIDLAALKVFRDKAVAQEELRVVYADKAHATRVVLESHTAPISKFEKKLAQFLKRHYSKNPLTCTDWGFVMTVNGKFTHPKDAEGIVDLLGKIDKKHKTLGAKSPLLTFLAVNTEFDYAAILTDGGDAQTNMADISDADKKVAEYATARDEALAHIVEVNVVIGNYLKSVYVDKTKLVVAFGFDVSATANKPKERKGSILPTATKMFNGVLKGSEFKNIGEVVLHLYPGKDTKGNPIILKPGEGKGMNKGFSVITVVNPNDIGSGKYSVWVTTN